MKYTTIIDIAQALGISKSTVSRAYGAISKMSVKKHGKESCDGQENGIHPQ